MLDQPLGPRRCRVPDQHPVDRQHGAIGVRHLRTDMAGPDHQQRAGIGTGQIGGGERRGGRRAPAGQRRPIEQRHVDAGRLVEQQIARRHRREATRRVARHDIDDLDAAVAAIAHPGRHHQQRGVRLAGARQGVGMAKRRRDASGEYLPQPGDQRRIIEGGRGGGGVENEHDRLRKTNFRKHSVPAGD